MTEVRRIRVRWDAEMGCYRVNVPEWDGGEVVPAEAHDAEVERLREALRFIADGHIAPRTLSRLALDSPHGIGGERREGTAWSIPQKPPTKPPRPSADSGSSATPPKAKGDS